MRLFRENELPSSIHLRFGKSCCDDLDHLTNDILRKWSGSAHSACHGFRPAHPHSLNRTRILKQTDFGPDQSKHRSDSDSCSPRDVVQCVLYDRDLPAHTFNIAGLISATYEQLGWPSVEDGSSCPRGNLP